MSRRGRGTRAAVALAVGGAMACGMVACGGSGDAAGDSTRDSARDTATVEVAGAVRGCAATRSARPATDARDTVVRAIPVNRGTHGMIARTRWLASPDGCALLVVEDPAAVEAEPVPNGGLLVSERGARPVVVAIDSAWDVAVDSAWTTLAIGRGWLLQGGASDTVPRTRWEALARATGVDARTLEARSFNGSGMAYARGVSLAFVQPLADGATPRLLGPGGWRVRWRHDTLFVGDAPARAQDHAEPTRWTMHVAPGWEPVTVPPTFAPAPERWAEGPLLDIGGPRDSTLGTHRVLELAGGRVAQSRGGEITLLTPGQPTRTVGQGALLAATLGGRFLLAIRATPRRREADPELQLVVYEVP